MAFNIKPILGKPRKLARISARQKGYARDLPRREPPWHLLKSKRAKFKVVLCFSLTTGSCSNNSSKVLK